MPVAATLLLGTINSEGSLILRVKGNGPLRTSVARITGRRIIRRFAHDTEQVAAGEFVRHTLESDQCHHPTLTLSDYDLDGDVDLLVGNGQLHFTVAPSERSCLDLWENKRNPQADAP